MNTLPARVPGGRIISALLSQSQDTQLVQPLLICTLQMRKLAGGDPQLIFKWPAVYRAWGGDPVLGLFADPGLVYTLPVLEDLLPKPLKNTSLKYPGRIL